VNQPSTQPRRGHYLILIILTTVILLGLGMRVVAVSDTVVDMPIRTDAADYLMYAYNLRFHGVYSLDKKGYQAPRADVRPDAVRSPGYPLSMVQAVLGTLVIAFVFLLGRTFLPAWASIGAALLTAISPHLINTGVYVLSETWFSFLLAAGLLTTVIAAKRTQRRWPWLAAGLLLGAAALTRPGLQFLPFVLAPLLWFSLERSRRLTATLLLLVGFSAVLAPWFARNELVLGASGDPQLEINFLQHGMYPDFMYRNDPKTYGYPYAYDPRSAEVGRSVSSVLREIDRRFREEPARHLSWYLLGKPAMLWSWNIVQGAGDAFIYPVKKTPYLGNPLFEITHTLMGFGRLPLVILGAIGTLLAWLPAAVRRLSPAGRIAVRTCSLLVLYYTAVHMVGAPFPRYSIPVLPILFAMALFAVTQLVRLRRRPSTAPSPEI